ncbi:histone H2B subacrosomal variant-like [Nannospalax galili]|uniref:histone H2B subacrosomal variant-like n=1 Tax=Nannospalax galili TaxID=1026970 RepID=UPI0004ED68AF|nr:histone H2B subacrosomal variant-like [Nannospalax galili]
MAKSIIKKYKYCKGYLSPAFRKQLRCSSINFGHRNYFLYIKRVMKEVVPQRHISARTVDILNILINDLFERIATKACHVMYSRNRCTLTLEDLEEAVYQLLPRKLAEFAVAFGNEAVHRFFHS